MTSVVVILTQGTFLRGVPTKGATLTKLSICVIKQSYECIYWWEIIMVSWRCRLVNCVHGTCLLTTGVEHTWIVCLWRSAENSWWISFIYACFCRTDNSAILSYPLSHGLRQLKDIGGLFPKLTTDLRWGCSWKLFEKFFPLVWPLARKNTSGTLNIYPGHLSSSVSVCFRIFVHKWEKCMLILVDLMYVPPPHLCSKTCQCRTHTESSLKITPQSTPVSLHSTSFTINSLILPYHNYTSTSLHSPATTSVLHFHQASQH